MRKSGFILSQIFLPELAVNLTRQTPQFKHFAFCSSNGMNITDKFHLNHPSDCLHCPAGISPRKDPSHHSRDHCYLPLHQRASCPLRTIFLPPRNILSEVEVEGPFSLGFDSELRVAERGLTGVQSGAGCHRIIILLSSIDHHHHHFR